MAAVTICSDFGAQKNKVWHCFHCLPIYFPWSDGTGCHDLFIFWMLSFKPTFSLSTFTFIKRLFSSSSISAIRVFHSDCCKVIFRCKLNLQSVDYWWAWASFQVYWEFGFAFLWIIYHILCLFNWAICRSSFYSVIIYHLSLFIIYQVICKTFPLQIYYLSSIFN